VDDADFQEQREDLRQTIEREQAVVRVALRDLSEAAGEKLDVKSHIQAHPLGWMVGAFLVGFWLGRRTRTIETTEPFRLR